MICVIPPIQGPSSPARYTTAPARQPELLDLLGGGGGDEFTQTAPQPPSQPPPSTVNHSLDFLGETVLRTAYVYVDS